MGKFNTAIAFLTGTVLGGLAVWYITKERYAQLAEEEINSVREAYTKMNRRKEEDAAKALSLYRGTDEEEREGPTPAVTTKVQEKGSIAEYAERIKNGGPMDYSKTSVPAKATIPEEPVQAESSVERPYVIPPEEFDELDGYTPISLTYFADGVLADEHGVIVDDVEEIVGDALDHFGEYEEDSVFVRSDAKRCDYEILRDERKYEEFRATLPPNI